MRTKHIVLAAAVLIAAFTPLWAIPDVPILQVDTLVNLSKTGGGEAGGSLFLPDGNIIAIWKGRPMIIDSKSGEIIRNLDALSSGYASDPKITKDGTKLITRVSGPELAIWDIPSGKIIKQFKFQVGWCCISPDGTKMYVTLPNKNDNPGTIAVYDMATFEEIERLSYQSMTWGDKIDISPDGQTLAVSVGYKINDTFNNKFILINLNDKKNYTTIESLKLVINSMEFSPDGKKVAFHYNDGNGDNYIYIYNLVSKEKKYIRKKELEALFGIKSIAGIFEPRFIDDNNIYTGCDDLSGDKYFHFSWNLIENRIKNYIDIKYTRSIDLKDSLMLLCNQNGIIGLLNKNKVSVKENKNLNENFLNYRNNQLEYNTNKSFIGISMVYDTTGKMIIDLGTQPFVIGVNIIKINQPLLKGVYLLTIKDKTEQSSYKFIVE
ncbi:MAG: T9SS type A sorting domain-containing protein [bacterium]